MYQEFISDSTHIPKKKPKTQVTLNRKVFVDILSLYCPWVHITRSKCSFLRGQRNQITCKPTCV